MEHPTMFTSPSNLFLSGREKAFQRCGRLATRGRLGTALRSVVLHTFSGPPRAHNTEQAGDLPDLAAVL